MFDDLKRATARAGADRRVRALLLLCRRLLSERGEANSVAIARQLVAGFAALYLAHASTGAGGDPVARFHLDNGARMERLNPLGDLSAKGLRQSFGMMVNYLYDLDKVEAHHEQFVQGTVAHSRQIAAWL